MDNKTRIGEYHIKVTYYPGNGYYDVYDGFTDKYIVNINRNVPLIFIGGMPRSGTTLMRAFLDAHPHVRCGEETRVIPRITSMHGRWASSEKELTRLKNAGVWGRAIDSAIAAFILSVIFHHGEPAQRLCNKDPFTLKSAEYLTKLFPRLKFLYMIRDGRATVHSIIERKITITGFDLNSYSQCLEKWDHATHLMYGQCHAVGPSRCLPVYYEQSIEKACGEQKQKLRIVLHPESQLRRILKFLELPWNSSVLHHEDFVGKKGGISLSLTERSTDQVIRPINTKPLTTWYSKFPKDVLEKANEIAPMLKVLGYDGSAPPYYGKPDDLVANKTAVIVKSASIWEEKEKTFMKNLSKIQINPPPPSSSLSSTSDNDGKNGGGNLKKPSSRDKRDKNSHKINSHSDNHHNDIISHAPPHNSDIHYSNKDGRSADSFDKFSSSKKRRKIRQRNHKRFYHDNKSDNDNNNIHNDNNYANDGIDDNNDDDNNNRI